MPDASPLGAFVEQWNKNQELGIAKAKQVADKTAEEWTRQFKVQQAQTAAAQQTIDNQFEARKVASQEQAQARLEKEAAERERKNKAHEEFLQKSLSVKQQLDASKTDFKKWQSVWQGYLKTRDQLIYKGDLDPVRADEVTRWMLSETDANIVGPQGTGAPVPMPGTQPQQHQSAPPVTSDVPQVPPAQGNSILSSEGNPLAAIVQQLGASPQGDGHMPGRYGVPPAGGAPDAAGTQLPGVNALTDLRKARADHINSLAESVKLDTEIKRAKIKEMAAQLGIKETEAKKKLLDYNLAADTYDFNVGKSQADLAQKRLNLSKTTAETQHLIDSSAKIRQEIRDLKAGGGVSSKMRQQMQQRLHTLDGELNKHRDEGRKSYDEYHKLDLIVNSAPRKVDKTTGKPWTDADINMMRGQAAANKDDWEKHRAEEIRTQNEINQAQKELNDLGTIEITHPSGKTDAKGTSANNAAVSRDAARSQREVDRQNHQALFPAPVRPGPATPGTLGAKKITPAPSGSTGLKKNFKAMSKDELKKYIKDHGG